VSEKHVLTLETMELLASMPSDDWDMAGPWPPYGVSEREEADGQWWADCPRCGEQVRGWYCQTCGRS
jgi:hypothetical protein